MLQAWPEKTCHSTPKALCTLRYIKNPDKKLKQLISNSYKIRKVKFKTYPDK